MCTDYYGRQNVSLDLSNISQIQYRIELPRKIGENCCLTVETYVDFYLDENLINARFVATKFGTLLIIVVISIVQFSAIKCQHKTISHVVQMKHK